MERKKLLTAAVIAAIAIALVAGALATRGEPARTDADDTAASSESSATGATSSAEETGAAAQGDASTGSEDVQDREVDQDAVTKTPTAQGEPAAPGSELDTVTVPPAETLAFISQTAGTAGDKFRVAFRPYGLGPVRSEGRTLVIRIDSALRSSSNASNLVLAGGTNAIALVSSDQLDAVSRGGSYSGTIELTLSGGALALELTDAAPAGP